MNAAKRLRRMLDEANEQNPQLDILKDLVLSLQLKQPFELSRLYEIDYPYFSLAMTLLDDWRLGHHIASRSKLVERLFCLYPELMNPAGSKPTAEPAVVAEDGGKSAEESEALPETAGKKTAAETTEKPTRNRKETVMTA